MRWRKTLRATHHRNPPIDDNDFVNRGIAASRLRMASYGEDDPEHAAAHDETRRLNRRVALMVNRQP
jgi:outer membrane protein OmpA-like peptidoglycan-associated protein